MKKRFKALSILLAILMAVSTIFLGTSAETLETVNVQGTEIAINRWYGTHNEYVSNLDAGLSPTIGEVFSPEADQKPLIPEFPSNRLTYGWSKEGNAYGADDLISFFEIGGDALNKQKMLRYTELNAINVNTKFSDTTNLIDVYTEDKSKGLMFYIKLDEESKETRLYLEALTVGFEGEDKTIIKKSATAYDQLSTGTIRNSKVYLMSEGTNVWTETTALRNENGLRCGGEKAGYPSVNLAGGFEGWVYMPAASWLNYTTMLGENLKFETYRYLYRIDWFFDELVEGKDIQISNIMVVDGDVTKSDSITVGDFTYNFADNRYYIANTLTDNGAKVSLDGAYGFNSAQGKIAPSYGASNSALYADLKDSYNRKFTVPSYYNYTITPVVKSTHGVRPAMSTHQIQFLSVASEGDGLIKVFTEGLSYNKSVYTPETWPELFKLYDGTTYVGGVFKKPNAKKTNGDADKPLINAYIQTSSPCNINNKAILAYVKHQGASEEIKVSFQAGNYQIKKDGEIFAYDLKTGKWTTCELIEENECGSVKISKDFEGWFMLPAAAFKSTSDEVNLFRICPDNLGGKYGELLFGNITLIDSFNPLEMAKGSAILLPEQVTLPANFPFEIRNWTAEKFTAAQKFEIMMKDIEGLSHDSNKTFIANGTFDVTQNDDSDDVYISDNVYNTPVFSRIGFNNNGENLIAGTNKSFAFRVDNSNGGKLEAIIGVNGLYMSAEKPYYLLSDNETSWSEPQLTSKNLLQVSISGVNKGYPGSSIIIPEEFTGWISIPYSTFNQAVPSTKSMHRIDFFPIKMTGSVTFECIALFSTEITPQYYMDDDGYAKGMNATIGDLPAYSAENAKYAKIENGVLDTNYEGLYATVNVSGKIAANGGLMFYAKNNDSKNAVTFKTSVGDVANAKIYTLSNPTWSPAAANGYITLPANFEGWVKLAVADAVELNSIDFTFTSLTDGFALSSFTALNSSDDLNRIKNTTRYATGFFYTQGDLNIDGNINICDMVYADEGHEIEYDFIKFVGDQVTKLKEFILKI